MTAKFLYKILFLITIFSFTACLETPAFYENNVVVDKAGWQYDDVISFDIDIDDTESLYNLFINIRHTSSYEYANAWVYVKTIFPDGTIKQSPINLPLAADNGKWYGKGTGDIISHEVPIQNYAQLPKVGKYTFEITQHMRTNPLQEVMDVGLILRKTEKPN